MPLAFPITNGMDIFSAIILGVVQGLTEFLPISSSGHLILAREILGLEVEFGLSVDAILHLATAFAILAYFWKDFLKLLSTFFNLVSGREVERSDKVLLFALILATIPAVILGLLLEGYMETVFRSATLVAVSLLVGSLIMFLGERYAMQNRELTLKNGLIVGLFQSLALIPGMSRSGMVISGGLFLGLTRERAARFAFLLGFPLFLGSGIKKLLELSGESVLSEMGVSLFVSASVAFLVGIFAIHYLLKYLREHTLNVFIFYRVLLAIIVLSTVYVF